MIDIDRYRAPIKQFITTSILKFTSTHKEPTSIGIYCCPWAGWLTTNYNIEKTLEETQDNCPDFEFVAFDHMELHDWQDEYENDFPVFIISGKNIEHNHDLGDEKLNELFFSFLEPIIIDLKLKFKTPFFLQMLDSNCYKTL